MALVVAVVAAVAAVGGASPASATGATSYAVTATVPVGFSGSDVTIDPGSHTAYVVNTNGNSVTAIDTTTNTVKATIPVGIQPSRVAVDPGTHRAYVTNTGNVSWPGPVSTDRTVSVIDTITNTVTDTITLFDGPIGVAVDPGTHAVYVGIYLSGQVAARLDPTTNPVTVTTSGYVGSRPWAVAVDPGTHLAYVSALYDGTVSVLDGTTIVKTLLGFQGPSYISIDPATHRAYVIGNNGVSVIDTTDNTVTATTLPTGNGPAAVAIDPVTNRAYVPNYNDNTVSVVDLSANTIIATVPVGTQPRSAAVDPSTHSVYVTNGDNTVSVISLPSQTIAFTSMTPTSAAIGGSYTATATGGASGNPVTFSTTSTGCTVSTDGAVVFTHAGDCVVAADQAGNDQYAPATRQTQTISVAQNPQAVTISSAAPASAVVGDTYTVTASGTPSGNAITFGSGSPGICSVAGDTVTFLHAGTCTVLADQVASQDYSAAPQAAQQIAVGRAAQAITFTSTAPTTGSIGSSYTVTATGGGSGNDVRFSTTSGACAVSGSTVFFLHAGTCAVNADQSGSSDYTAAPQTQQSIAVSMNAQTVTITSPPPTAPVVGTTYRLTATGGASGQPVMLSISPDTTNGACTISAATVSFLHPGSCVVSATQAGAGDYAAATAVSQSIAVSPGATATHLTVTATALIAQVAVTAPAEGTPTGAVVFSVGGAPVGSAPLLNGTATLAFAVPTGASRQVAAVYGGDADFTGSSVSTSRNDPSITASVTSAYAKTQYGWYRSPVTVAFHCTTHGAALSSACPASVLIASNGAGHSVTRTISAADGGTATIVVRGINLDQTAPSVSIGGVRDGAVYNGVAPSATCVSSDALSGIARCTVTKRISGTITTVTALATDRAGNVRSSHASYTTLPIYIQGVAFTQGAFTVTAGHTYTIVVLGSSQRPTYVDAAVYPNRPSGHDNAFHAAGYHRWVLGVTVTDNMRTHTYWNLGIQIGPSLREVKIRLR